MRCPKCNGLGFRINKNYPNPASWNYAGEPERPCRYCNEMGFIIGNTKEVLDFLKVLEVNFEAGGNKDWLIGVRQCIKVFEE